MVHGATIMVRARPQLIAFREVPGFDRLKKGRAARGPPFRGYGAALPLSDYYFLRVAYAPAACPSEKWALKPPNIPVGRPPMLPGP